MKQQQFDPNQVKPLIDITDFDIACVVETMIMVNSGKEFYYIGKTFCGMYTIGSTTQTDFDDRQRTEKEFRLVKATPNKIITLLVYDKFLCDPVYGHVIDQRAMTYLKHMTGTL